MKQKHIKLFEELNDEQRDDSKFNVMNYNTLVNDDISNIIVFFLEDVKMYEEENGVKISKESIQSAINEIKEEYSPSSNTYYSAKEKYEEITDDGDVSQYF